MSYQSPYQPPQPHYPNYSYYAPEALAPARRAGMLMYILGGLALASSMCCVGVGAMLPQVLTQQPDAFSKMQAQMPELTQQMLQVAFFVISGLTLVGGLVMIILGRSVRAGSKVAVIISIVLDILAVLFLLIYAVAGMVFNRAGADQTAAGLCMMVVPIGLLVLLLTWLFGALKASDHVASQQYAMQYWQYAQQQAYGQQQQQYAPPPQPPQPPQQFQPPQPPPPSGDSSGPPAQG